MTLLFDRLIQWTTETAFRNKFRRQTIGSRTDDSNDSMKSDCDSMESDCGEPNPSSSINRGATQSQSWADIVRG